jgi:hypothetical protein
MHTEVRLPKQPTASPFVSCSTPTRTAPTAVTPKGQETPIGDTPELTLDIVQLAALLNASDGFSSAAKIVWSASLSRSRRPYKFPTTAPTHAALLPTPRGMKLRKRRPTPMAEDQGEAPRT